MVAPAAKSRATHTSLYLTRPLQRSYCERSISHRGVRQLVTHAAQCRAEVSLSTSIPSRLKNVWSRPRKFKQNRGFTTGRRHQVQSSRSVNQFSEFTQTCTNKASKLWLAYEKLLKERPLCTKALTSCVGLAIADTIAQAVEGGLPMWDVARTTKLATFGLVWHGISAHLWYQILDSTVLPDRPSSTSAIVGKMVLDQAFWAPVNTALFYGYMALLDGNLASLPLVLETKLIPTVLAGYALWPMAHLINFKFIPPHQRLLYINVVNLFWTIYLSRMANTAIANPPVAPRARFGLAIPVSTSTPSLPDVFHV